MSYSPDKLPSPTRLGAKMDTCIHLISAHTILSTEAEGAQEAFASITVLIFAEQGKSRADSDA